MSSVTRPSAHPLGTSIRGRGPLHPQRAGHVDDETAGGRCSARTTHARPPGLPAAATRAAPARARPSPLRPGGRRRTPLDAAARPQALRAAAGRPRRRRRRRTARPAPDGRPAAPAPRPRRARSAPPAAAPATPAWRRVVAAHRRPALVHPPAAWSSSALGVSSAVPAWSLSRHHDGAAPAPSARPGRAWPLTAQRRSPATPAATAGCEQEVARAASELTSRPRTPRRRPAPPSRPRGRPSAPTAADLYRRTPEQRCRCSASTCTTPPRPPTSCGGRRWPTGPTGDLDGAHRPCRARRAGLDRRGRRAAGAARVRRRRRRRRAGGVLADACASRSTS